MSVFRVGAIVRVPVFSVRVIISVLTVLSVLSVLSILCGIAVVVLNGGGAPVGIEPPGS